MKLSNFPLSTTLLLWIGWSDGPNGRKVSGRDPQCARSVRLTDLDLTDKVVVVQWGFSVSSGCCRCYRFDQFPISPLPTTLLVRNGWPEGPNGR